MRDIERSLTEIKDEHAPVTEARLGFRTRAGDNGLGALTEVHGGVAYTASPFYTGRLAVEAQPVFLTAGSLSSSTQMQRQFGSIAVNGNAAGGSSLQSATGVAGSIAYFLDSIRIDAGVTGAGFPVNTLIGGVSWSPKLSDTVFLKTEIARRPVKDSLLSYAGTRDPGTGQTFGGVARTGGGLEVGYDEGGFGAYAKGGYNRFDGTKVAGNSAIEMTTGAFIRPIKTGNNELKVGVALTYLNFEKNLSHFTIGHGGYFSPQNYVGLGIPIEYTVTADKLKYAIGATIGVRSFKEKAADYYPNDASLQSGLVALAATDATIKTSYPSHSSFGLGGDLRGNVEYAVKPNLSVRLRGAYGNSTNYSEAAGGVFVKYRMGE